MPDEIITKKIEVLQAQLSFLTRQYELQVLQLNQQISNLQSQNL